MLGQMEDHNLIHAVKGLCLVAHELTHAINRAVETVRSGLKPATVEDLKQMEERIIMTVKEWAEQEQADLTEIKGTLDGIATGVANLNKLITDFQNSPGTLSAQDQKFLDDIQAQSKALAEQAKAIKTEPPTPSEPPTP